MIMKNNITIQDTSKVGCLFKKSWKWFSCHALKFGVCFAVLAYLLIFLSFGLAGSFMGLACLLCFWADDIKK